MGVPPLWWVWDDHEYSCPWPVCMYDSLNPCKTTKKSIQRNQQPGFSKGSEMCVYQRWACSDGSEHTWRLTWDDDSEGGTNPLITMSSNKTPSESRPRATWVTRRISPVLKKREKRKGWEWRAAECRKCWMKEWCPLLALPVTVARLQKVVQTVECL